MEKKVSISELISGLALLRGSPNRWVRADILCDGYLRVFVLKYYGATDYDEENLIEFFDYLTECLKGCKDVKVSLCYGGCDDEGCYSFCENYLI